MTSSFDVHLNVSLVQNVTPLALLILPREMTFNDDSLVSVITYAILLFISAIGNLTVFITLFRNGYHKSRVNMFIMHLCIADMIVTFVMIPMEIGWHVTVAWFAGDAGCRIFMFFRAFGFYLSSFVLISISFDRYFAIAHPLSLTDANQRGKIMLVLSWIISAVASSPQSVIFHLERHPQYKWFAQCVTFNFFPSPMHELAYNLFNMVILYVLPLCIILITYSMIVYEITKKTKQKSVKIKGKRVFTKHEELRRSSVGRINIQRARCRSLKMTIVIVAVFVICWTPYFVISAWWWFDKESAKNINPKVARGLFNFAVSNSCVNPIVYGMFTAQFQREFTRFTSQLPCAGKMCFSTTNLEAGSSECNTQIRMKIRSKTNVNLVKNYEKKLLKVTQCTNTDSSNVTVQTTCIQ